MTFDNIFKSSRDNQTVVCLYDCNYCTHSINFFKLTNVVSCKRQPSPSKYFAPILVVRHVTAFLQQSKTGAQWSSSKTGRK